MKNDQTIAEHLVVAYLSGQADDAQRQEVEQWLAISETQQEQFRQWEKAWKRSGSLGEFEAVDVDKHWKEVQSRLGLGTEVKTETKTRFMGQVVWRYAAAVLLIAVAAFLVLRPGDELQTFTAEHGRSMLQLPDGTEVWLNKNASISYPKSFSGDERRVNLSGEAFFEVTHNPEKPFIVASDGTETRVLGTSFNINEKAGARFDLVLVTGKVSFEAGDESLVLAPGDLVSIDAEGNVSKTENTNPNFLAWKTRVLEFDNVPMQQVAAEIARLYEVEIEVENEAFQRCPLTTSFQNEPLEQVLESIEILFDAEIVKTNEGYVIRGRGC